MGRFHDLPASFLPISDELHEALERPFKAVHIEPCHGKGRDERRKSRLRVHAQRATIGSLEEGIAVEEELVEGESLAPWREISDVGVEKELVARFVHLQVYPQLIEEETAIAVVIQGKPLNADVLSKILEK